MISQKHANFIINHGNATAKDIKDLIKLTQSEVKKKFNVELSLEQEIIN
jgi:UDP-N-acetylmuramate dehydrogenase